MSFSEIKAGVPDLTAEELAELESLVQTARRRTTPKATPEMLARRREVSRQLMAGEWSVDLPSWEEMRKLDKAKDPWNA
ncbi:MAG TPA: hypothetical protein VGO11_17255 [Chthoniobacteraceae bacterium]|jgi:hypothetical protein|nr:hypothetical protein [Chthoniobacteraceae bacterium]